ETALVILERKESNNKTFNKILDKTCEIYPIPKGVEFSEIQWEDFQRRFERRMRENGFPSKLANAITGAMAEMADNVEQHSESTIRGLVGFEVSHGRATYTVVDVGVGVFNSLRTNPKFINLRTAVDAIFKALHSKVSRFGSTHRGLGFDTIFRSLADLNGCLRFRSDDGCVSFDGRSVNLRKVKKSFVPFRKGFQLTISCSL
ncbi:MAG: hypothetical protein ACFFDN_33375, partial [Candidatus Hodarchaeota archaeon]